VNQLHSRGGPFSALADDMAENSGVCSAKIDIAIVVYGYGLGNSPSLINMSKALSKFGFCVDFFIYNTYLGNIHFNDPSIRIYNKEISESVAPGLLQKFVCGTRYLLKTLLRILPTPVRIAHEEKALREAVQRYVISITSILSQKKYAYFIGVEPLGMMAASALGARFNTPFIYYNMELHSCPDIISVSEWAIKNIERSVHSKALFTITQDEKRARIMARENEVAIDTFVTIPVCADGEPFRENPNFLRQRLGISSDKTIVLYAGFLADWALCRELAEAAQSWPDNYVLVLHSHGYHDAEYVQKLRRYEGDKVRFSDIPVDYEDLSALLASADIGIALYRDLGTNFTLIGSASGKLAHYLKSGLPVVVNDYPDISGKVEMYNCGVWVKAVGDVGDALVYISRDYAKMRAGAFHCYEREFRFSRHFQKVLKRMGVT